MHFDVDCSPLRPSRREFVLGGAGATASGLAALALVDKLFAQGDEQNETALIADVKEPIIQPGDTILFQGDSITDAGRKRDATEANAQAALGNGYAWLAAAQLLVDRMDGWLQIFNRGISGHKVYQLAERWQADCLDIQPNVLSILIGVNDFWHKHKHDYQGTLEKYETDYRELVERTKDALPDVKLVICEPFVLKVGAVDESWFPEFDGYRAAAQRVAEDFADRFVAFQTLFDRAVKVAPAERWAADGVHPTADGAALMAHWWLKAVAG